MTGLERVLGTLGGGPVDRRVFAPVLSLYGARLTGTPLRRHLSDAEAYARGAAAVRERFDPDVLFAPFAFAHVGEAFGSEVREFDDQPPNVRRPAVASAADWGRVAIPDPERHPRLRFLKDSVARLAAAHGGQVAVGAPIPSPVDLPALVMGLDAWLDALLFDPDAARRILDDTVAFFVALANGLFDAGANLVVVPSGLTAPRMAPRDLAERLALPALQAALGALKGPAVFHHVGAPMLASLDLVAHLPNVVAYALDEADDPGRAREIVGDARVLLVGPSGPGLNAVVAVDVERQATALLERLRSDPRIVLFTSGADVPIDTPPENLDALRRAVGNVGVGTA